MAHQGLLQDLYLFQTMNDKELATLGDTLEMREYKADEDIFNQGDAADATFIIKSGVVRIHQKSSEGDNIEVAVLGEGSHFGEMSFIDGEPRSAAATIAEDAEILKLEYSKTRSLMEKDPEMAAKFYQAIARFLCGRLRVTTTDLSYAREKNLRFF